MTALAQFEKAWFVIMPFNKKKVGNLHSVNGALLDGAGWALASYQ